MTEQPRRIQRRRTKGWRMPEGAVYVGRPSRWGNPFTTGLRGRGDPERHRPAYPAEVAARLFRERFADLQPHGWFEPLRGRDLVCWCPLDQPCHADVLLELANR